MSGPAFHLAFPVRDLESTRSFYGDLLGCSEGRSSGRWVDFDFHGHQITAHLQPDPEDPPLGNGVGPGADVDGDRVPVPHFGLVLEWQVWHELADRLRGAGASFLIEPRVRFQGQTGEQATFFLRDPSGNALEFKAFQDPQRLFQA